MTTVIINGREIETAVPVNGYNNWKGRKFNVKDNGDQLVDFGDSVRVKGTSRVVRKAMSGSKLKKDLGRYLLATSSSLVDSAQNSSVLRIVPNSPAVLPIRGPSALIQKLPIEIRALLEKNGKVNVEADAVSSFDDEGNDKGDRVFTYNTPLISTGGMFDKVQIRIQVRGDLIFISGRNIPLPNGATLDQGSIYIKGDQLYVGAFSTINGITVPKNTKLFFDDLGHQNEKGYISFGKDQIVFASSIVAGLFVRSMVKPTSNLVFRVIVIRDSVCVIKNEKITVIMNSSKSYFSATGGEWRLTVDAKKGPFLSEAIGSSSKPMHIVFKDRHGNNLSLSGVNAYEPADSGTPIYSPRDRWLDLGSTITINSAGITTETNSPNISRTLPLNETAVAKAYQHDGISDRLFVQSLLQLSGASLGSGNLSGGHLHGALMRVGTSEARAAAVITPFAISFVTQESLLTDSTKECNEVSVSGCANGGTIYVNRSYRTYVHEVAHVLTFEYEHQAKANPLGKADVALKVWDAEMGPYIPVIKKSVDGSGKATYTWEDGTTVARDGYANPQTAFEATTDKKEFIIRDVKTGNSTWKDGSSEPRHGSMTPHGATNRTESIPTLVDACTNPGELASLLNPKSSSYKKEDAEKIQFGLQWLVDMEYITPEAHARVMTAVRNWKPGKK